LLLGDCIIRLSAESRIQVLQCPYFKLAGAPLRRRTAVGQHRHHKVGTSARVLQVSTRVFASGNGSGMSNEPLFRGFFHGNL